jgi:hypothetical protein
MEVADTLIEVCQHLQWHLQTPWMELANTSDLVATLDTSEDTETGLHPTFTIGSGFLSAAGICCLTGGSLCSGLQHKI